jgi:hypothetical protein
MRRMLAVLLALLVPAPAPSLAWNAKGHRVIASIAYRQLDEPARRKLADILKRHPAAAEWATRDEKVDETLGLLWHASVFPDEARREPWTKYGRPRAHFVNFRIMAEEGNRIEPPVRGENILNSYVAHLKRIGEPKTTAEDRALHLSWMLHQAGDIHQPLHAVARFSKALPEGDRGGNQVHFPNPRARGGRQSNLHAYWDDLLGVDSSPEAVERLAEELTREFPVADMAKELSIMDIGKWAEESAKLAVDVAYRNLDANITRFADKPLGYEADAVRAARMRAATAGYRLGRELGRLVAGR